MPRDLPEAHKGKRQHRSGAPSRLKVKAAQAVAFGICCIVTNVILGRITDSADWPRLQFGTLVDASANDILGRLLMIMGLLILAGTPIWFAFARRAAELAEDGQ